MNKTRKDYEAMVSGPGKFEGCDPVDAYFYEVSMNGDGEELADQEEDGHYAVKFTIGSEDVDVFPELFDRIGEDVVYVEDSQGFWYAVSDYANWSS